MQKRRIYGTTNILRPGPQMAQAFGDVGDLAVKLTEVNGQAICQSAWEATPDEIVRMALGGSLIVSTVGQLAISYASVEPPRNADGEDEALNSDSFAKLIGSLLETRPVHERASLAAAIFNLSFVDCVNRGDKIMGAKMLLAVRKNSEKAWDKPLKEGQQP